MFARSTLFAAFIVIAGIASGPVSAPISAQELESEVAGTVARLQGSALAIQDATPRILKVGAKILVGDVVSTGANSRLELKMIDDGIFTLGARTNFVVMEYAMQENRQGAAVRLLEGAIGAVSGQIASLDNKNFRLETETATIGIRGTTFWGGRLEDDMEFALLDGKGIIVTNAAGSVEINTVGDGTSVAGPQSAPTAPITWSADKLRRARETVSFQ